MKKLILPESQIPSPNIMTSLPDPLAYGDDVRLTDDEHIIAKMLAGGMTRREMQRALDCGYKIVQRHVDSLYRKLKARNDANVVFKYYVRFGDRWK